MRDPNKKLTLRQAAWLRLYMLTGNATDSARRAGYVCKNDASYRVIGCENLTKLDIEVKVLMTGMGLDDGRLLRSLLEGLDATQTRFVSYQGRFTDERLYPDWSARLHYLTLAFRLKGYLSARKENGGDPAGEGPPIRYTVTPPALPSGPV